MAGAYSQDLRDRVIDAVVGGKMSRRGAGGAVWSELVVGDQMGSALRENRLAQGRENGRL